MHRKKVFVVGNCQASAIANLYRDFVGQPNHENVTYFDDHMVPQEKTRAAVADADLLIVQDRDFNHGLVADWFAPHTRIINFPMVMAGFVWPFANEPHVRNVPEPPFSDGPYPSQLGDSFLNRLITKGVAPEEALERYLALDIGRAASLDRMAQIYFDKQRERDRRTGFDVAPVVEARFQSEALFRTPHHPNAPLFGVVAAQLLERLDVPAGTIDAALRSLHTTPFPLDELPIHPGVIRHFGLTFADEDTRYSYFDEGRFTFRDYVLRYMAYENNHPLRHGIATAFDGDPADALARLDEGLARSPDSMRGWRARGIALDRLRRHAEACESFARAVAVDPGGAEGLIALSGSHRMAGEHDEAIAAAERAVAIAPFYAHAHHALAAAQMAVNPASAVAAAATATRMLPSMANLQLLGLATAAAGDLDQAEAAARGLVRMDPGSPDARNLLAEILEDRGRRAEAIAVLDEGMGEGARNGQTFSLLGNFHWRNGDLVAAEAAFAQGVTTDPGRPDLADCRDAVRGQLGMPEAPPQARHGERGATAEAASSAPMPPKPAPTPRQAARRLPWLPAIQDWAARIREVERLQPGDAGAWDTLVALAGHDLDLVRTTRLDTSLGRLFGEEPPPDLPTAPVRLAVLGSSTIDHLLPAIRVAAARRGLWVRLYRPDYGQFRQEILDPASGLHAFRPTAVLFALDAFHLLRGADPAMGRAEAAATGEAVVADLAGLWGAARAAFRPQIIQTTLLPVFPAVLGLNEQRLPGSPAALVPRVNAALAEAADAAGVDLLPLDRWVARDGLVAWHDPVLWHRAKQEITPLASPLHGDLVARLLGAAQGRSAKCLVLDLDNTLWGGVVGDDGPEGIVVGQGSAAGEAFAAFQAYAAALTRRGVLLAACSKNDEAFALAAFNNPGMVLKRGDFSAFVANWSDKATNLRAIAATLNIGLDALVFVDDNPFERELIRRELPQVAVPELPDDPAGFAATISDGGWFEALAITAEDGERTRQYQANQLRAQAAATTDLPTYLRSLGMRLLWKPFDRMGLKRVTQLVNKTNQFNLTTRRYAEEEIAALIDDPDVVGLQFRLVDRFGDNGVVAVVIGRMAGGARLEIDTWLMSCRVLGRDVEAATLAILVAEARRRGAREILGRYRPSARNAMVAGLLPRLGFVAADAADGVAAGTAGDAFFIRSIDAPGETDLPMTIERENP